MVAALANYHVPVRDWPEGERPREKLADLGAEQLSNSELLAIILREGVPGLDVVTLSLRLLQGNGGIAGVNRMTPKELTVIHGVGPAKAAMIKAAFELGRRAVLSDVVDRKQVKSAHDVHSLFEARMRGLEQEELHVVLLSTRNHVIGTHRIYTGNVSSSMVRPAEVLKFPIRDNAPSIILAHNHPSGDPTPSPDDVRVTREIVEAARVMSIEVLDHLIIGDVQHGYVSLRERRLGFD